MKGKSVKHWIFILGWTTIVYFETIYSTKFIADISNSLAAHAWGAMIVLLGLISPMHGGIWDKTKDELRWSIVLFPFAIIVAFFLLLFAFILIPVTMSGPWWLQSLTIATFVGSCFLLMMTEKLMVPRTKQSI